MSDLLVQENANLRSLLVKGLIKDMELRDEDDLSDTLFEKDLNLLARPSNTPWVKAEGIVFQYGPYEIAPFAAGMPAAVITVKEAMPHLTSLGKALLK